MLVYDKKDIKETLTLENVFTIVSEFGGEPEYTSFGLISSTICHNEPGVGSRKLYYYSNSGYFKCFTGCANSIFDIFELVSKVMEIQNKVSYDLNDSVRWVASYLGISGKEEAQEKEILEDWSKLRNYDRIQDLEYKTNHIILKEYDDSILNNFNYSVKISPWLKEGITQEVMNQARIGYYPGGDQITIPHYDIQNRFVGLRGRSVCAAESELYGKYRPLKINKILYNHPLGMNLYNLNNSKENIKIMKKAIIFEAEKSTLKMRSYFGASSDISVANCGSSITAYQIQLLLECGAEEIIIGFDRQFQKINDDEFKKLKNNLLGIHNRYRDYATISFIFDKEMITDYKASPVDEGPDKFLKLFKERITL